MKKLLWIVVLGLLLSTNAYAGKKWVEKNKEKIGLKFLLKENDIMMQ